MHCSAVAGQASGCRHPPGLTHAATRTSGRRGAELLGNGRPLTNARAARSVTLPRVVAGASDATASWPGDPATTIRRPSRSCSRNKRGRCWSGHRSHPEPSARSGPSASPHLSIGIGHRAIALARGILIQDRAGGPGASVEPGHRGEPWSASGTLPCRLRTEWLLDRGGASQLLQLTRWWQTGSRWQSVFDCGISTTVGTSAEAGGGQPPCAGVSGNPEPSPS